MVVYIKALSYATKLMKKSIAIEKRFLDIAEADARKKRMKLEAYIEALIVAGA